MEIIIGIFGGITSLAALFGGFIVGYGSVDWLLSICTKIKKVLDKLHGI